MNKRRFYEVHLAHGDHAKEAALGVGGELQEYDARRDQRTLCFGDYELAARIVGALRDAPLPRGWTHLKVVELEA